MSIVLSQTELLFELPCTSASGKIRIKERSSFEEYGLPVASRQHSMKETFYVEWQIGYDLLSTAENESQTTLKNLSFVNNKGETKLMYELSEILFYSLQRGLVSRKKVHECLEEIKAYTWFVDFETIARTSPEKVLRNGIEFSQMMVSYPLLVHDFDLYHVYAEIMVREKQRAVGIQPMLYVCLPITSLRFKTPVVGRVLEAKETARWIIGEKEASFAVDLFRIFGMLSDKHHYDTIQILEKILENCDLEDAERMGMKTKERGE